MKGFLILQGLILSFITLTIALGIVVSRSGKKLVVSDFIKPQMKPDFIW